MKITSVKAVPASHSTTRAGIKTSRNYVFVKIETDEGITGWGEATCGPLSVATMVDEFGKVILGTDFGSIMDGRIIFGRLFITTST